MIECRSCHVEPVLQRWIALRIRPAKRFYSIDMISRVSRHVAHSYCQTIAHSQDAQLRNWICVKVLPYKGDGIGDGQQVPRGSKIFLHHSRGKIQHQDCVSDDAALQRSGIFGEPETVSARVEAEGPSQRTSSASPPPRCHQEHPRYRHQLLLEAPTPW